MIVGRHLASTLEREVMGSYEDVLQLCRDRQVELQRLRKQLEQERRRADQLELRARIAEQGA